MIKVLRWLLLPLSGIYAFVVWLRNRLYDSGMLKSSSFDIPVVIIGNLAVGGTGKSPMTEHILRIVNPFKPVAVLSRGYGRSTKGYRLVNTADRSTDVGDEPLQIKRKFPKNEVVVCEDRVYAIGRMQEKHGATAILLDDAYQHRKLKPSFAVLLFDCASTLEPMLPMPTGNFRDSLRESKRADVIVVTKCPESIDPLVKAKIISRLSKHSAAPIFFSKIAYQEPLDRDGRTQALSYFQDKDVLVLTGIANPKPLYAYLEDKVKTLSPIKFPDHHQYAAKDFDAIATAYNKLASSAVILTTEKDFQRLPTDFLEKFHVYYLPIQQEILFDQADSFSEIILGAFGAKHERR